MLPRGERIEQPVGMTREIWKVLILQTSNVAGRARDREVTAMKYAGPCPAAGNTCCNDFSIGITDSYQWDTDCACAGMIR